MLNKSPGRYLAAVGLGLFGPGKGSQGFEDLEGLAFIFGIDAFKPRR